MARKRKLHIGMVNVVTHPHSPEGYVELFRKALNVPVSMGGDLRAKLGTWAPINSDPLNGIQGNIFRYSEIDMDSPWLDTEAGKMVDPEELEQRVNVPESLKPSFSTIWFNFYPKTHCIVFEVLKKDYTTGKIYHFAPSTAQLFFQKLFNRVQTKTKFTSIHVTIIQSQETLRKIFSHPRLTSLDIVVDRPNPTDGTVEEEIERQLEEENVTRFEQFMSSSEPEGLKPSERTKALAQVATSNGYVEAIGQVSKGKKVLFKTIDKPVEDVSYYDPKQGLGASFYQAAQRIIEVYKSE